MTYDASRLSPLGNIHWLTEKNDDLVSVGTTPVFSLTMKEQDQVLCLNVFG